MSACVKLGKGVYGKESQPMCECKKRGWVGEGEGTVTQDDGV